MDRRRLAAIEKWERRKVYEWGKRGMLREDGTLRCGPQFKRRPGRPWKIPKTDFEIGREKLKRDERIERYRRRKAREIRGR